MTGMISIKAVRRAHSARSHQTVLCCLLLVAHLPKLIDSSANERSIHPTGSQRAGSTRRYALAEPGANYLSPGDARTSYQLLDSGNGQQSFGLVDGDDAALFMASDLLSSFQPRPERAPVPKAQRAPARTESLPGHYEFEVAPKMEPPSAPKPPFEQATTSCPGSDLFGGFSPKHTLCGDLYQGRVPLNPMGQFVNDQAYPFELIKNKTLQFLARSLPVLKSEYETIPKVARYLPANQLLNPTSHQSPLGHEHFHALNQLDHQSASELIAAFAQPAAPPFLRKRRSVGSQQQQASVTVAELMPNATLVVSSAHSSSPGRIGGGHHYGARSADALPGHHFTMITKDGFRPFEAASASGSSNRVRGQHDAQHRSQSVVVDNRSPLTVVGHQQQQQQQTVKSQAANQIGSSDQADTARERHHAMSSSQTIEIKATNSDAASTNQRQQAQQQHLLARSAPQLLPSNAAGHQQSDQQDSPAGSGGGGEQPANPHRGGLAAPSGYSAAALPRSANKQQPVANSNSPLKCSNVNGLLMYTVCQAASALIEPAESSPTWLQAAKQIGTLYAAASNTDGYSSSGPTASPFWALWNALAPGVSEKSSSGVAESADQANTNQDLSYKSSSGNQPIKAGGANHSPISSVAGVINLLNPLMSFFGPSLQRAGDAGGHSRVGKPDNRSAHHSSVAAGLGGNLKTLSNLVLTGLSLAGLYDWLGTSGLFTPTATTFARRKKPFDPGETFVDTPASLAAMASAKQLSSGATVSGGSPLKQPPTPCPSVEEYISPTFARNYQGAWKYVVQIPHEGYFTQTIQRSSCMRQKCEFTEGVCHEAPRWVSLLVAEIYYPNAVFGAQAQAANPQIATDRLALDPSGQVNAAMLNQMMATSPSTNQLQQVALGSNEGSVPMMMATQRHLSHQAKSSSAPHQDPLQMTDSFNNYNQKLQSAFLNAANELGLDPMNMAQMQQLANAHNYQFLQRNGLLNTPQNHYQQIMSTSQAPAEPRSGLSDVNQQFARQQLASAGRVSTPIPQQTPQQQFADPSQQVFGNDYIKALAIETIRRHPHLSIDELIKSLQMQQSRRKRDTSSGNNPPSGAAQQQHQYNQKLEVMSQHSQQAHRSSAIPAPMQNPSLAESSPSINELGTETHLPQQQQPHHQFELPAPSHLSSNQQHQYQQAQNVMDNNPHASLVRSNHIDQQQNGQSSQSSHDIASANQQAQQAHGQRNRQQQSFQSDQQQTSSDAVATSGAGLTNAATSSSQAADAQVECDGHDKIGCYVVRVYYDWFLVNGSCKCWKTSGTGQQQSGQASSGSSSSGSAGFIRRIFTG